MTSTALTHLQSGSPELVNSGGHVTAVSSPDANEAKRPTMMMVRRSIFFILDQLESGWGSEDDQGSIYPDWRDKLLPLVFMVIVCADSLALKAFF